MHLNTEHFTLDHKDANVFHYTIRHPGTRTSLVLRQVQKDSVVNTDVAVLTILCKNYGLMPNSFCLCNNILEKKDTNNYDYIFEKNGDAFGEFLVHYTNLLTEGDLIFDLCLLSQNQKEIICHLKQTLKPQETCTMFRDIRKDQEGLCLKCNVIPTEVTKNLFIENMNYWRNSGSIQIKKTCLLSRIDSPQSNNITPINVTLKNESIRQDMISNDGHIPSYKLEEIPVKYVFIPCKHGRPDGFDIGDKCPTCNEICTGIVLDYYFNWFE